jgi:hypothetical protein
MTIVHVNMVYVYLGLRVHYCLCKVPVDLLCMHHFDFLYYVSHVNYCIVSCGSTGIMLYWPRCELSRFSCDYMLQGASCVVMPSRRRMI